MLFHVDQQCLFRSVSAHTRNKPNPTGPLSPAQVLRTSIDTNYNFWQQNQVAMNKNQIVPFLTALSFTAPLIFPMKTTKFPPNVIQLLHTWFAGRISLWLCFLLLFNPLRNTSKIYFLDEITDVLDTNQTNSFLNSSCCWHLTPTISKLL